MKSILSESVNLILTSPPFALTRKKDYGNVPEDAYVDWFVPFAHQFQRVLTSDGSLVIDLGGAYRHGVPVRSLYQYELLIRLCRECKFMLAQEFFHYNPARLPAPAEWVNIRRIRVKDSVNVVWWLSKVPFPKADNKQVLQPYSDSMKSLFQNGYRAKSRPSGHTISDKFNIINAGAIPANLLTIANTESNSAYLRKCAEHKIRPHSARFPERFAEFFISFLTEEGDLVLDPFAGSNTTGAVAERMRRKWISIEIEEEFVIGSRLRFERTQLALV